MTDHYGAGQPLIFLSFAGADRPKAKLLREDLAALGYDTFLDERSIPPGGSILSNINRAMGRSTYCVLLWSKDTPNRPWVEVEWEAALTRDLNEKRTFLFVIRLDDTEPPLILSTRRYLDAFAGWDSAVKELDATWRRDHQTGTPVFPAPVFSTPSETTISLPVRKPAELYVRIRNQALSVSHVVNPPSGISCAEFYVMVRRSLDLRDTVSELGGLVSARFTYELWHHEKPLNDGLLTGLGINDGDTIDLVVNGEIMSNGNTVTTWVLRAGPTTGQSEISPRDEHMLITAAFGHLMP